MVKHHVWFCLWLALALCVSEAANIRRRRRTTTTASPTTSTTTTGQPTATAQASTEKDASDSATAVTDANTLVGSAAADERQEFDKVKDVSLIHALGACTAYASGRFV